jgi:serine/threonine protein kinase
MIGTKFAHYHILDKLGSGAMGVVYRARDQKLKREVAIKVLPKGMVADEMARKRLKREARSLSRLNHPNVEILYDFDTFRGVDFLVVEYVHGENLHDRIGAGPLPECDVLGIGAQIAAALEAAHECGVVHRDLKPANVLVSDKGLVKVLDFGVAKARWREGDSVTSDFVDSVAVVGTLPYMAPEQLEGNAEPRSDLFSAGAVLYEMATGEMSFPDDTVGALIDAVMHDDPRPPRSINRSISVGLEGVILKALEKDADRRYQTAAELREDLERLQSDPSSTVGVPEKAAAGPRGTLLWAVVGLAALGLVWAISRAFV